MDPNDEERVNGTMTFFLDRPRLGDLLARKGLITPDQLASALAESQETRELLGRILIRRGYVFEHDLARTLAEQLELPYVDVQVLGVDRGIASMLPVEEGRRAAAIPVAVVKGRIRVVFADPSDDAARSIVERFIPPTYEVTVGDLSAIESAWSRIESSRPT